METRTPPSTSKAKEARYSRAATPWQLGQRYLARDFGVTISEAGRKMR